MKRGLLLTATTLVLSSCLTLAPRPQPVEVDPRPVSFLHDVKPVLDARCAVCHSCYNAACQLKVSSYEGIDRGGSKIAVYGTRLKNQAPTRLFVDAQTTAQWRNMGFHSVTDNTGTLEPGKSDGDSAAGGVKLDSIMAYFLDAKRRSPVPAGEYRAETDLTCAADTREVRRFLGKNPERGMPFGFPALQPAEQKLLTAWLAQGARGPTAAEQATLTSPSPAAAPEVEKWESFLNQDDPKHVLTARYLYEHFFLAHLRLAEAGTNEFFTLVRSVTPPGQPISVIATVRPYDDPGVERFYYRLEKIHSTIVYKTHIVVELDDERLARYRELFIDTPWLEQPHRMPFEALENVNPFLTYAQIPPKVRYQFLLDNSEYTIRTFIRGPVCKGQVALDVIHDHFWVLFLDPEADEAVLHPEFLIQQADNLRLPNERGSDEKLVKAFSNEYRDLYANFYQAKNALYDATAPQGYDMQAIWRGNRAEDSPMLTVYRHFDNASVHKGALGDLPRTFWVIDYAQFERIYYALVAGFDVFGNVSHQSNVRRYMDYLRVEGELNFLNFLPAEQRKPILQSWYIGVGAADDVKVEQVLTARPSRVNFSTDDPKREFAERVISSRLNPATGVHLDPINYHGAGELPPMPKTFSSEADLLAGLRALTAPGTGFIRHVTNSEANILYVRVRGYKGKDLMYSIVINRWHDNVNSMFREKSRLDPSKDTMDFLPGNVSAYPNYFLDVAATDLPELFDVLENFDGSPAYVAKFEKFGVNRSDERFWPLYDWFQEEMNESDPVHAGLFDLNRYYSQALAK